MSIASITRIVKFIRMGERGNSVITAVTPIRRFTLALWQKIGSNDYLYSWANISNAANYKAGDTIVINGVVTDKDDVSIMYYGKVVSTKPNTNTVTALGQTIIISGTNGSSFMAQYSKDGSTDWHATFTDGDIYMRTSADSGKTWSNAIRIVGEKGDETNYAFAWSRHKTLEDGEDPLSDIVDWYDYPPKQPDGKPYLWVMITTPDNKVSYARLTGEKGDKGDKGDQGNDGEDGQDGQDAITIDITPTTILHKKVATNTTYSITIKVYEGIRQLLSSNGSGSSFKCSVDTSNFPIGLTWSTVTSTNYFMLNLNVAANATPSKEITISIVCKGVTYKRTVSFKTVADGNKGDKGDPGQDGAKGERGAVMRGPQAWSDCAVGYNFQSGADGEEFKDVVMYGNNYYSCIKSHTKTASNNPTSATDTNNGYWKLADKFEIVATKILLAQYALVKNLGVEAIDMKDSAGNIIFQAKDGNVICNSGTFNNITVKGNSTLEGIVRANLFFGKICKVTSGTTYTIDPETNPYNCYYVENPSKRTFLILPKAANYDGLEILVFTKMAYNTSWFTEKCTYIKPQTNDDFYVKVNVGNIVASGIQTSMTVERFDVAYTNFINTTAMTLPNIVCRFKSIGGAWYAIEGIYTGE